ncbi:MAG: adenylate/guanylate cyclase domain-containing protein [Pseudomonadota bacterium]
MGPRFLYSLIVGAVILASLALRVWDPAPVARLRSIVFDSYQRLAPLKFDPETPVRIVDIDEESLRRLGQWPWPRTILSDLLAKMRDAGAATIGFDMVFPEPDRMSPSNVVRFWPQSEQLTQLKVELDEIPSNDEIFAEAIGTAPVVMGFIASPTSQAGLPEIKSGLSYGGDDPRLFAPYYPGATSSLTILQTPSIGAGALNWVPEHDQIIRRMPILVTLDETLYPSFSADLLRVAQGASTYIVKSSGASGERAFGEQTGIVKVRVGDFEIPTDANGQMWLHFSPQTRDRYLPAWKILNGELGEQEMAGRILLVGTSAAGLLDLRATPLEASVPGVELHAQAVEQIIRGDYLLRPDFATPLELLYILVLGLIIAVLIYRAGALGSAVLGGLAVGFVVWLSWHAFNSWGWLVDPVYATIALTAIYLTGSSFVFLRTERERNRVRHAFSHYMAPALVEQLADEPDRLKLGGENRDMTLLFSDVRGFTTISEGLDAEELTRFLNELFTPLSNIVLDEKGTIDKYMGDALMAFWNAPLDDPRHPSHACAAALRMVDEMAILNERWRKAAEDSGRTYKPVKLGIGLNTGVCCVGNLGSETRFDYSVIGDNVNVASRLEGQSKTYGLEIIAGEETATRASDFAFLELDLLKVKGKTEATRIFGLLGDDVVRQSSDFVDLTTKQQAFLSKYRQRDWDEAEALLKQCEALGGEKLAGLYALYRDRITDFRSNPPPKDWDGTARATSK